MTALKAMTIWPAWQHFEEATKGSIEIGKLADFVILSKDPTAVDPETLDRIKVFETIKAGVVVFEMPNEERQKLTAMSYASGAAELAFSRGMLSMAEQHEELSLPPGEVRSHASHGHACSCKFLTELAAVTAR